MTVFTKIAKKILEEKIARDITSICKRWGVNEVAFEFDTLQTLFLVFPKSFTIDLLEDLQDKGYKVTFIHAIENKVRVYVVVKKQF